MILTKIDKVNKERRQAITEEYSTRCSHILGVAENHIFKVENYSYRDWRGDGTMEKNLQKEKQVLIALNHILQPGNDLRPIQRLIKAENIPKFRNLECYKVCSSWSD